MNPMARLEYLIWQVEALHGLMILFTFFFTLLLLVAIFNLVATQRLRREIKKKRI